MTIALGIDPGAERLGWGLVEGDGQTAPTYLDSGLVQISRDNMGFQPYRMELTANLTYWFGSLIDLSGADLLVNETVPAVGGGNFVVATQSYLANVAVTVFHTLAIQRGYVPQQIGATTIKKAIGGKGSATKVGVRNGVIALLPELAPRKGDWTKVFDEPDSLAASLTGLGYGR